MAVLNNRNYKPLYEYKPYYEIACEVIDNAFQDLKKAIAKKTPNTRKIAEIMWFYKKGNFQLFSNNNCDYVEHLERRGITMQDIKRCENAYDEYTLKKKNVKNGMVVRLKSTGNFYIKLQNYICPISVKYPIRFSNMKQQINSYCTGLFNAYGNMICQTIDANKMNYSSMIIWEQIRNGFYFVIETLQSKETYTKQGGYCYEIDTKNRLCWEAIGEDELQAIFKKGERYDI